MEIARLQNAERAQHDTAKQSHHAGVEEVADPQDEADGDDDKRNPTDPAIAYVLRRFIPRPRDIPVALEHIVQSGERLDLLAAQIFGNAELYWRIADANAVTDPFETTDTLGGRIVIPAATGS